MLDPMKAIPHDDLVNLLKLCWEWGQNPNLVMQFGNVEAEIEFFASLVKADGWLKGDVSLIDYAFLLMYIDYEIDKKNMLQHIDLGLYLIRKRQQQLEEVEIADWTTTDVFFMNHIRTCFADNKRKKTAGWVENQKQFTKRCKWEEYFIIFLSSSSSSLNLKIDRLPLAFIARNRFDFSEQWFLFFPNLIKYKEKEILSVKMVSQHQTKDSGSKKNGDKELGMVAPQDKSSKEMKSSKKMKFASSSAETEPTSQTTISDDSKTGRVVHWCLGTLQSSTCGQEMVPIPKDIKEQIWEAVDMAFVVGQGGKNSVLASAAKKWKDFKYTLTRHYILPYTNDKEKLSQPPETYKFIEKAQ
ncbi:hypothetical protein L3X38_037373 [Prunus dulcis]|uniref:Uncharacterized protein n=1 Tax=Prunus dulcis TaxID=3755 RepID=A0AAD4V4J2_PRUDU|nr:hypothetical protein L3X38_037373 [Prunus dulcis]